jgi:hypothetical protein
MLPTPEIWNNNMVKTSLDLAYISAASASLGSAGAVVALGGTTDWDCKLATALRINSFPFKIATVFSNCLICNS